MEVRERLIGRVQLNFALLAAVLSFVSYMVRMVDFDQNNIMISIFFTLISFIFLLSFFCLNHLLKAFWGNEYKGMPSPNKTDQFRDSLIKHKASIDQYNIDYPNNKQTEVNINTSMKQYLYEHYRDCSSHNTFINDTRSSHIHHSFKWLLFLTIPFVLASIVFISGNLDVSSPRKETPIINKTASAKLESINTNLTQLNSILSKVLNSATANNSSDKLVIKELTNIAKNLKNIDNKLKGSMFMSDNKAPPATPSQPPARKVIENNTPKPKL
jgi:hypothetical protein